MDLSEAGEIRQPLALTTAQRWLLSLLMLGAGLLLYLLGSPYFDLIPTNRNPSYALLLMALFLALCGYLNRQPRLHRYWRLAYGLFTGAGALWLLETGIFNFAVSQSNGARFAAADKLMQLAHIVPTIMLLTLVAKIPLGDIYLRRGELKAGLRFGLIAFLVWSAIGAGLALGAGVSFGEMGAGVGWVLIFVLANAFMEELWFRGIFLKPMAAQLGRWPALAVTTVVFGLSHMGATYINPAEAALFVAEVSFVGAVSGYVMLKYDHLWAAVLFHAGADVMIMLPILNSL